MSTKRPADLLSTSEGDVGFWRLERACPAEVLDGLPYLVRIFLENVLRHQGSGASASHVEALLRGAANPVEFPFFPARVILQDFTGVPVLTDLAAMRSAMVRLGGDPSRVNPKIAVDMVVDHSVQVDAYGDAGAFQHNVSMEYARNRERYSFLRWAQHSFSNLRVVPPGSGIVHQVNLEYLSPVVCNQMHNSQPVAFPDTLVGTDSHTPMIGGLGVLGWGVGGIEAEAAMLGEPVTLLTPMVVGVRLSGKLPEGASATDLVLTITEVLRRHGVVGKFVEFFGQGVESLSVADRATVANMSPEYGATQGYFPVDKQVLSYMRATGRPDNTIELVERYCREQRIFREPGDPEPTYSEVVELDLAGVQTCIAGPKRPQDRTVLAGLPATFHRSLTALRSPVTSASADRGESPAEHLSQAPAHAELHQAIVATNGSQESIQDGSVVIAAITSCTSTSNPASMIAAGLIAKAAVEHNLKVLPTVKTSLAPGSAVVMDYLRRTALLEPLESLGFSVVGFGCTTCIGNSGPLPAPVAESIEQADLVCAAVLSGNRNFEGRIHPQVRMSFLASPALVVAFALAGTVNIDLTSEPLGTDPEGNPVMLADIWPLQKEILELVSLSARPQDYRTRYARIFEGDAHWHGLAIPQEDRYAWTSNSTYLAEPPFLKDIDIEVPPLRDIAGGRVLLWVGDTITTDHISPAGHIPPTSDAAKWLYAQGVAPHDLHTYGARRGQHEVMVRGTFANIRLRNALAPETQGGMTVHFPSEERLTVFDAAQRYQTTLTPLIVIAGEDYGAGSSRDWAAKGTALLGVRMVLAKSYERIHRANLAQMGILPLQFLEGQDLNFLGLDGTEIFNIKIMGALRPAGQIEVEAVSREGKNQTFLAQLRLDTEKEIDYFRNGGILPCVLRRLLTHPEQDKKPA